MTFNLHPMSLIIRKLSSYVTLNDEDRAALLALPHSVRTVDAGTYLVREGETPGRCTVVLSGYAYRQKITGEGARQIMAIHLPGDFLDLQNLFLELSDHNVQALIRSDIAFVPREALQDMTVARPTIARAMWIDALVDASMFREWIMNVGRRDARARIAHLLCEFALRLQYAEASDAEGYILPMTQEQLADAVGLTPVHVNRILRSLTTDGLIKRERRYLSIVDWDRMRVVADFTDRYLHLDQTRPGMLALQQRSQNDRAAPMQELHLDPTQ